MHRPNNFLLLGLRALLVFALFLVPSLVTAQIGTRVSVEDRLREKIQNRNEPQPGTLRSDKQVKLGGKSGVEDWDFPSEERRWLQGTPLTKKMLEGKAAVMIFFEEECPRCATQWPNMSELSNKYEGKPVAFIAVNSGSDPRKLKQYARQTGLRWSLIADYDRAFENAMNVNTVSMDNTVDVRYITADGVSHRGKWSDLPATIEAALDGATWKVDPKEIPNQLQDSWYDIEFGNYAKAASQITKHAGKSGTLQEPAQKLLTVVEDDLDDDYEEAKNLFRKKEMWEAYKQLTMIQEKYDGYELPKNFEVGLNKLKADETVKAEEKAMKSFDKAMSLAERGKLPQAKKSLQRLISDASGTEAANKSEKLMKKIEQMNRQQY